MKARDIGYVIEWHKACDLMTLCRRCSDIRCSEMTLGMPFNDKGRGMWRLCRQNSDSTDVAADIVLSVPHSEVPSLSTLLEIKYRGTLPKYTPRNQIPQSTPAAHGPEQASVCVTLAHTTLRPRLYRA
eukprot:2182459-Rhodomonas_salina.2